MMRLWHNGTHVAEPAIPRRHSNDGARMTAVRSPGDCSRGARAAMFAAVCVLLAAVGHTHSSGTAIPWWVLASAFVVTTGLVWTLAARERGRLAVTSTALATQALLHCAFTLGSPPPRAPVPADDASPDHGERAPAEHGSAMPSDCPLHDAGHQHTPEAAGLDMAAGMGGHDPWSMPAGMLLAHLAAAALSGLWLAHGERAAFQLLRALAGLLHTPLNLLRASPSIRPRPTPRIRAPRHDRPTRLVLLVHVISSRGPPAATAVP